MGSGGDSEGVRLNSGLQKGSGTGSAGLEPGAAGRGREQMLEVVLSQRAAASTGVHPTEIEGRFCLPKVG